MRIFRWQMEKLCKKSLRRVEMVEMKEYQIIPEISDVATPTETEIRTPPSNTERVRQES